MIVLWPVPVGDGNEYEGEECTRNPHHPDHYLEGAAIGDRFLTADGTGQVELDELQVPAVDDEPRHGVEVVRDGKDEDEDVCQCGEEDDPDEPLVLLLREEIHFRATFYNW